MHVFLAGGSGAVGRALVPALVAQGHAVTATTTSPGRLGLLRDLGAQPVVLDGLDPEAVLRTVRAARPDAIVHQMIGLAGFSDPRRFAKGFATTDRLRTAGTDHLLAAAEAVGVERVVAQSFAGWPYARTGGPVKTEEDPLDPDPPKQLARTLRAIEHLERAVTSRGGVVLRYGGLYGPGTGMTPGGDQWDLVRARRFPIVGDGGGVWSFTHVEDAAGATVAALERWTPGQDYDAVDDDPAPVRNWLPALAAAAGAPPPRRVPRWAGRLMGAQVIALLCETRGASNAKARRLLAWNPTRASWREGFAELAAAAAGR